MNKALILFLVLAGLAAFVNAADVAIQVGGDAAGSNVFVPAEIKAAPGDNLVFTWKSGKHSILPEDEAKSCAKSAKAEVGFLSSGGAFEAPKTWTVAVPKDATGKLWFYCGVPGHCNPGTGGMEAVVEITGAAAPADGGKAPADGKTPTESGSKTPTESGAAGSGSPAATGAASQNYNSLFFVFSSMCMAAAYNML